MPQSLTAAERETVILMDDASDVATITSAQRPIITKLKNNPAAVLVDEQTIGSTLSATFTLPAEFLSFRTKKATGRGRKKIV